MRLKDQGKLDEAVACYRRALELKPDHAEAHNNLGNALKDQGKLDEAVACYRQALELKPDYAEAHSNLGNALKDQGKLDEAVACYRRALELKPDYAEAHSNLLLTLQYCTGVTPAALAEAHAEYDRRHAAPLSGSREQWGAGSGEKEQGARSSCRLRSPAPFGLRFARSGAAPGRLFPGPCLGEPQPTSLYRLPCATGWEGPCWPGCPGRGLFLPSPAGRGAGGEGFRRFIRQAFFAIRKTQGRTRSGSRRWSKLSNTLSNVSCATSSASSRWPHISQL